jgi:uncharacterized protein
MGASVILTSGGPASCPALPQFSGRLTALAAAALVFILPWSASSQAVPAGEAETIQIDVSGTVERLPDMAVVSLGVTGDAPVRDTALSVHYENLLRILSVIREAGVPAKDVEQRRPNIAPLYEYTIEDGYAVQGRQTGFRASTGIQLTLRDMAAAGATIQSVVRAGATYIQSISFELSSGHNAEAHSEARASAIKRAERLAWSAARATGASRLEFVSAAEPPNESDGEADLYVPPIPADTAPALKIEPGAMEVTERVRVTFRALR